MAGRMVAGDHAAPPPPAFVELPFNVLSVGHLARLLDGELLADGPRLDWARLLRRTYAIDPLSCPHCGSRLRVLAEITDPPVVSDILEAVGWQRRTPPRARAPAHRAQASPSPAPPNAPPPSR